MSLFKLQLRELIMQTRACSESSARTYASGVNRLCRDFVHETELGDLSWIHRPEILEGLDFQELPYLASIERHTQALLH